MIDYSEREDSRAAQNKRAFAVDYAIPLFICGSNSLRIVGLVWLGLRIADEVGRSVSKMQIEKRFVLKIDYICKLDYSTGKL